MILLYEKEVDYSLLIEGFTVPNEILPKFINTYGEIFLGEKKQIKVNLEETIYTADFRNINRKKASNVYQVRYRKNGRFARHLQNIFLDSFKLLEGLRGKEISKKMYAKLPPDKKEYLLVYHNPINNQLVFKKKENTNIIVSEHEPFDIKKVQEIKLTGLLFNDDLLYRYALSLLTKPFVILSGLSGSGKTRLAMTFAKWLSKEDSQIKMVSVGSDWSNREYLLGYPNALDCGKYIEPENGVLSFILKARENPTKPYFLILDEMNLSYVERYFADFLSTMESHEYITLHPNTPDWEKCEIPAQIKLPPNLYITGTINVDETTYMFSPKVLDRANVIEFRISEEDMNEFLTHCKPLEPEIVNAKGSIMEIGFTALSKDNHFEHSEELNATLLAFFKELKKAGAEFGYRTVSEIYRFITLSQKLKVGWDNNKLVDIVVMQKMLPKLHGSRKKMQPILESLWKLCLKPDFINLLIENEEIEIDERFKYPMSATKIGQMYKNAKDNGFTSYAEA